MFIAWCIWGQFGRRRVLLQYGEILADLVTVWSIQVWWVLLAYLPKRCLSLLYYYLKPELFVAAGLVAYPQSGKLWTWFKVSLLTLNIPILPSCSKQSLYVRIKCFRICVLFPWFKIKNTIFCYWVRKNSSHFNFYFCKFCSQSALSILDNQVKKSTALDCWIKNKKNVYIPLIRALFLDERLISFPR